MNWPAWHWRNDMRRYDECFRWCERRAVLRGFVYGWIVASVLVPTLYLYLWLAAGCRSWTNVLCGLAH